ncbi:MAG: MOSC N-terminal beta barrel domain-containing protein [Ilumatobacteraceae bacterium]
MSESIGTTLHLSRFPVKSMQGESLSSLDVTVTGVLGDRAYAVVDAVTGKVLSGKTPRLGTRMLSCRAAFAAPTTADGGLPPVRITLPDGGTVSSDAADADARLSRFFGTSVRLSTAAPDDFTIDETRPDLEDPDPAGPSDTVVEARLGGAFFAQVGMDSPLGPGSFLDLFPVSLLTTSTLGALRDHRPESRFDERRFRMNVVVDTPAPGFVENGWLTRAVRLGDTAEIVVALPDPRCVMTTLGQDDLPADRDVLRTIAQHNRLEVAGGQYPCAGVYAVVTVPGTVRLGDPVQLL